MKKNCVEAEQTTGAEKRWIYAYASFVDINNNPDNFASKGFVVFGMPVLMVGLQGFCCFINDFNAKNIVKLYISIQKAAAEQSAAAFYIINSAAYIVNIVV